MLKRFERSRLGLLAILVIGVLSALVGCTCSKQMKPPPPVIRPAGSVAQSVVGNEYNKRSAIGTNLNGVVDWSTEYPFIDVFKTSRSWFSAADGKWGDDRKLDLDEDGWVKSLKPGQFARAIALWEIDQFPAGRYIVLYDGEGEIVYDESTASNRIVPEESRPGRHVVDIDPVRGGQGLSIVLRKTNPQNPIRNIRVLMPGGVCTDDEARFCDANNPCGDGSTCESFENNYDRVIFNPEFVQKMRPFSVLRFMDWMATNDSEQSEWADRPKVSDARWSEKGVPVEIMVALVNQLKTEPWFTIPHKATDEYIENFAKVVRDKLDPKIRAWVEYSNEVWNNQFGQNPYVAQACAAGQGEGSTYNGSHFCYAERAVDIFHAWDTVFGADSKRVVRVLGSQTVSAWASERILLHRDAHKYADVLAIAPYFGATAKPENQAELSAMTPDQLLDKTRDIYLKETLRLIPEQVAIAKKYGLELVAYEGGPAYDAYFGSENDDKINKLFDEVNRHPRMGELYIELLRAWKAAGAQTFVNFNSCGRYSKWGRWGLLEYIAQPAADSPKYSSVLKFISDNPRWW